VVGRHNTDIANPLYPRHVAMATIFWFSIYVVHTGAAVHVRRRCGLVSNYFHPTFVLVPSAIIGTLVCSVVATVSASSVALLSCRVPSTLFLLLHFFVYVWQINDDDDDDITVSRVSTDAAVITRCVERRNFLTVRRVLYLNNVVKRLRVCCARSPRML